jgi:hypothetical protein
LLPKPQSKKKENDMNGIDPEQYGLFFVDRLKDACLDRRPLPDRESGVWINTTQLEFSPVYTFVNKLKQERSVQIYSGLIPFRFQCLRVDWYVEYANYLTTQLGHKSFDINSRIEREASLLQPVIESGKFDGRQVFDAWQSLFGFLEIAISDSDPFTPGLTMYHKFDELYETAKLKEPIFNPSQSSRKKRKPAEKEVTSAQRTGSLESFIS